MAEPRPPSLSRRSFLKMSLAAGAGLELANLGIRFAASERRPGDLPVHWRVGFHALTEADRRYLVEHPSILVGETRVEDLGSFRPDAQAIERPADAAVRNLWQLPVEMLKMTRATDEERRAHHNALVDAGKHGSAMVATDGDFWKSISLERWHREISPLNTVKTVAILGASGLAIADFLLVVRERRRWKDARQRGARYEPSIPSHISKALFEVMKHPFAALGAATGVDLIAPEPLNPAVPTGVEATYAMMDAFGSLVDEKNIVLTEAIIRGASASMALDARLVQELLRQNIRLRDALTPKALPGAAPFEMFFYTTAVHGGEAEDLYQSRWEYIAARVERYADRVIDWGIRELTEVESQQKSAQDVLDSWTFLTARFGYPIPSFAQREEFLNAPKLDLPDSPRAILYKRLLKRIVKKDESIDPIGLSSTGS